MDALSRQFSFRWWLVLAVTLATFTLPAAEVTYVVKRGDTLYGLARKHNLSTTELARRNGLSPNAMLTTGQRLVIPQSESSASARPVATPALPAAVRDAVAKAPVKRGRWKHIVIHHSGVTEGSMAGIDRYHREERRMENGLAYHFVIGNGKGMADGEIGVGRRWRAQLDGGHLRSLEQNKVAIGICLVGNFDQTQPTARQMESLTALVNSLIGRCGLPPSAVKTHQQINVTNTRCPGKHFPSNSFLKSLRPVN